MKKNNIEERERERERERARRVGEKESHMRLSFSL